MPSKFAKIVHTSVCWLPPLLRQEVHVADDKTNVTPDYYRMNLYK